MKTTALLPLILLGLATAAFAEDKPAPAKPAETKPADAKPAETKPDAAPAAAEVLDPTKLDLLKEKVGKKVTVEGRLVRNGENKSGTYRYLNFTENYHSSISLVVNVAKDSVAFSADKVKEWVGKKVRATGTVKAFNGDLQIDIEKWDQVQEVPAP